MPTLFDSKLWKSLIAAGTMAYKAGDFAQAARDYQRAIDLSTREKMEGTFLAEPLIRLAICLSARKDYAEAERLLRRALAIIESEAEHDLALLAYNYHELSVLLWKTERSAESQQMNDLALGTLDLHEEELAELRVLILKHRAILLADTHRHEEASKLLDSAADIALRSSEFGKNSLLYGQVLITKALLSMDSQKFDQALDLYQEAMPIVEMCWGPHHPKVADLYGIFANHAKSAGKAQAADFFQTKSHDLREWIKHSYGW